MNLGFGLRLGAFSRGGGGTVSNQAAIFLADTLANAGGWRPQTSSGSYLDLATVADQTGATRTWSISSGRLVANGTPGVDDGLALTLTTVSGVTLTATIDASEAGYSVLTTTQAAAAATALGTAGGKTILFRKDNIHSGTGDIRIGGVVYTDPLVITAEAGAVISPRLQLVNCTNVIVQDVEIYDDTGTLTPINLIGGIEDVVIEDFIVRGVYRDPLGDYNASGSYTNSLNGIRWTASGGGVLGDLTIRRGQIYDVTGGITLTVQGPLLLEDLEIFRIYTDAIQWSPLGAGLTSVKTFRRIVSYDFIGSPFYVDNPHVDVIQMTSSGAIADEPVTNVTYQQIVAWEDHSRAAGRAVQGLCQFNDSGPARPTGWIICNCFMMLSSGHGITMTAIDGGEIYSNDLISMDGSGTMGMILGTTFLGAAPAFRGNLVEVATSGVTDTDSLVIGDGGATHAYEDVFVAPTFTPGSFAALLSAFAMKPNGPADADDSGNGSVGDYGAFGTGSATFGAATDPTGWSVDFHYAPSPTFATEITLDSFTLAHDSAVPVFSARRGINTGFVPVSGVGEPGAAIEGLMVGLSGTSEWVDVVDIAGDPVLCDAGDGAFFGFINGGFRSNNTWQASVRYKEAVNDAALTPNSCYIGTHIIAGGQSLHRYLDVSSTGGTPAVTATTDNRIRFLLMDQTLSSADASDVQAFDVAGTSPTGREPMWAAGNIMLAAIPTGPIVVSCFVLAGSTDRAYVDDVTAFSPPLYWDNAVLVAEAAQPHIIDQTRPAVFDAFLWGWASASYYGTGAVDVIGPLMFGLYPDGSPVTRGATIDVGSFDYDADHFFSDLIDFSNGSKVTFYEAGSRATWETLQTFADHPVYGDHVITPRAKSVWDYIKGIEGSPWTDEAHSSTIDPDGSNREARGWAAAAMWKLGYADPGPIRLDWVFGLDIADLDDPDYDERYVYVGIDGVDITTLRYERDDTDPPGAYGQVLNFYINGTITEDAALVTFKGQRRIRLEKPAEEAWNGSDAILYQPFQEITTADPADADRDTYFQLDHAGVAVSGALAPLEVYPLDFEVEAGLFLNTLVAFEPRSASFNGSQTLRNVSVSGDGGTSGLLSMWVYYDGTWDSTTFARAIQVRSSGGSTIFEMNTFNSGRMGFRVFPASAWVTATSTFAGSGWHHVLWSYKSGSGGWNQVYVDDVATTGETDLTSATLTITGTNTIGRVYVGGISNYWPGDLGHVWFDAETELDISDEANRRKFISALGVPVDLGADGSTPTGSTPQVYCDGVGSGWNNLGTLGAFTVDSGSLSAGGTPGL